MPTYYYPPHANHGTRQRSYSQSYHPTSGYGAPQVAYPAGYSSHHSAPRHHSTAYAQQPAYYAAPQYFTPTYQYGDSSRHRSHHGHARTRSGGAVYYTPSTPAAHHSVSLSSPARRAGTVHYATSRRPPSSHHQTRSTRSHSVPRPTVRIAEDSGYRHRRVSIPLLPSTLPPRLIRCFQSESRPRETVAYNASRSHSHHRRGSSSSDLPLGERIRRMFGFGSSSLSYRYGDPRRGGTYVDARTGHPVDWRGRPVYRV